MAHQQPDDSTAAAAGPAARRPRIDGIDAARALAVIGMFTVHLGASSFGLLPQEGAEYLHALLRGNSSALFALLAGLSLAFMTGRTAPLSGDPWRRAAVRILTRALIIGLLGVFLDFLGTPVAIILTYYAGYFVLALPLSRLGATALWSVAGALALLGPGLSYALREALGPFPPRVSSLGSLTEFLLTGYYPAVTFMAFVCAGMAVGRLDLASTAVRLRLLATGAGLTVFSYSGSWLLLYPLGGIDRIAAADASGFSGPSPAGDPALLETLRAGAEQDMDSVSGQVPTDSWWWLATAAPHTGTTFEIAQAVGQALLVIVACVWLAERFRLLMYPLSSVGRMPLTVYSGHLFAIVVVMALTDPGMPWRAPWLMEGFVLGAVVFAVLWRVTVGRGPMEFVVGAIADGADTSVEEALRERRTR
ncbi:heparan-alpha-glucosaminide N-acetyltransferase domain-containing protein [Nocardiopsis sp. CNT312]|uniref:heparan-alpha-glucosaminide N-acetyltransferase domain-containing protein n=1 Tax=Nocardiopsis sp. CNT312 TaxID=1137268 RepID=UPI00048C3F4A|nr:heparan-alpha-glucosaminide N-acetyltransferase domain-containing protein [Nocardiopsis sp. CNT312]